MTAHITGDPTIPDPEERAARNAALFTDKIETGFWDDQGRVAPRPDDIDESNVLSGLYKERLWRRNGGASSQTRSYVAGGGAGC
jgi:hypothetical protein